MKGLLSEKERAENLYCVIRSNSYYILKIIIMLELPYLTVHYITTNLKGSENCLIESEIFVPIMKYVSLSNKKILGMINMNVQIGTKIQSIDANGKRVIGTILKINSNTVVIVCKDGNHLVKKSKIIKQGFKISPYKQNKLPFNNEIQKKKI